MKKAVCSRIWQVQALRDGSLAGQLAIDATSHLQSCADCKNEHAALATLQRSLQANAPDDQLALRRLRHATLAKAANQLHSPPQRPRATWPYLGVALAGLAAIVIVFVSWRAPAIGTSVDVQPSTAAVWTRSSQASTEYVDLAEGMLTITVHRHSANARLVVRVPDGEVEDTGTRFRVWVSGARTRQIAVETGSVIFRRAGAAPVAVLAGGTWHLAEPSMTPMPVASSSMARSPIGLERHVDQSAGGRAPARALPTLPKSAAQPEAGALHAAASNTSGATDEDLAYLHIVALLREARDDEARVAAQDYLRRYPDGFRRVEVSKIVGSARPR